MTELASRLQLRMSFLRWSLFIVPLIVLLGFMSSVPVETGDENRWYQALTRPDWEPDGWVFPVAWATLYTLQGIALTLVISARGARGRGLAALLFAVQFALMLFWPSYFFGMHAVSNAFYLIIAIFVVATLTTFVFGRICPLAAWLMVPYLAWLCFAALLNKEVDALNPGAETLYVPPAAQSVPIERED